MSQSSAMDEGGHVFRGILSADLEQFQSSRQKYVALEAARSLVQGLTNDENAPANTQQIAPQPNNESLKQASNDVVNEIFELQKEMSKNEYLHEKMQLLNKENDVKLPPSTSRDNKVLALQAEIEQAEILIESFLKKSNQMDSKIFENEQLKAQADLDLQHVKQQQQQGKSTDNNDNIQRVSGKLLSAGKSPLSVLELNTKKEIETFQNLKESLEALMTGLETLFQLKLQCVEVTQGNGVLITILIYGTHTFLFELDENKKLVDIQMQEGKIDTSNKSEGQGRVGVVDPLRLLCDCAQLAPPLDLRHALLASAAALSREHALCQHLKENTLTKQCLVQRHKSDPCKVEVTFRNGISAVLKIHDSYPNVPNGVYVESLASVGGWSEDELQAARPTINSRCLQTLPEMIMELQESFKD